MTRNASMSSAFKISPKARAAKAALVKETVDPSLTLAAERRDWEDYGKTQAITPEAYEEACQLGGVDCLRFRAKETVIRGVIVYVHGGGLVTGSMHTHRPLAAALAVATGCEVVVPNYRLLPEHSLTAPQDDLRAVLGACWARTKMEQLPLVLGGDSSGAAVALIVAAKPGQGAASAAGRLAETGAGSEVSGPDQPVVVGCFAICGAFDASLSSDSHQSCQSRDPILSQDVLRHWQQQLELGEDFHNPDLSPLYADLTGIPPVLLLSASDDVWQGDSVRMSAKLTSQATPCTHFVHRDMWHVWPMEPDLPESQKAFAQVDQFIQRLS